MRLPAWTVVAAEPSPVRLTSRIWVSSKDASCLEIKGMPEGPARYYSNREMLRIPERAPPD